MSQFDNNQTALPANFDPRTNYVFRGIVLTEKQKLLALFGEEGKADFKLCLNADQVQRAETEILRQYHLEVDAVEMLFRQDTAGHMRFGGEVLADEQKAMHLLICDTGRLAEKHLIGVSLQTSNYEPLEIPEALTGSPLGRFVRLAQSSDAALYTL